MAARSLVAVSVVLSGCSSFEDPNLVVDLRVLAMTAEFPEQIVDVDLAEPQTPIELLDQLVPSTVCALISDPQFERRVNYRLTLCVYGFGRRCDEDVQAPLASGTIADPESGPSSQTRICSRVEPNGALLGVLLESLEEDVYRGLGGLDYLVQLEVEGETEDARVEHASKALRVAPRIPVARVANHNPGMARIDVKYGSNPPALLAPGRCIDQTAPIEVAPGTRLRLTPIESDNAREDYIVPTLDGRSQMFTETLTYQWLASAGSFSEGSTGGTRDIAGNVPDIFTEWRAPARDKVEAPIDVQLWAVQRDERLGASWYEGCVRVVP